MKPWLRKLLKLFALVFCVAPPAAVTLFFFPVWYAENQFEIVIPAAAVLCFCFCAIPLVKWMGSKLKTPSAWMVWVIMFLVLFALEKIIARMVIISFVGALGNIIGAALWKIAEKGETAK